jgi:hypothetical protein
MRRRLAFAPVLSRSGQSGEEGIDGDTLSSVWPETGKCGPQSDDSGNDNAIVKERMSHVMGADSILPFVIAKNSGGGEHSERGGGGLISLDLTPTCGPNPACQWAKVKLGDPGSGGGGFEGLCPVDR